LLSGLFGLTHCSFLKVATNKLIVALRLVKISFCATVSNSSYLFVNLSICCILAIVVWLSGDRLAVRSGGYVVLFLVQSNRTYNF